MLAQRDVGARRAVVGGQLVVGHRAGEQEPLGPHLVLQDEGPQRRVVARRRVRPADEDEPVVGVDVALVVFGQPEVVFELLVRGDAADEEDVGRTVVERPFERRPPRRARDAPGVDQQRQHAGVGEAERLQLPAVVLGVAQRQIDASGQRPQLGPAQRGDAEDVRVVRREEMRRRDVVVLDHAPAALRGERGGQRRGDGEVQHRDVAAARRRVRERPHVAAEVVVDGEREDVRRVALAAQQVAHAARAVADRVSPVRRRQPLVDHQRGVSVMPPAPADGRERRTPVGRLRPREAP